MVMFLCVALLTLLFGSGSGMTAGAGIHHMATATDPDGITFWRRAIASKLCGLGGHTDEIAQAYFDCYQDDITPGGSKFVECQEHVYKVQMNSEKSLDKACMLAANLLPVYEDCVVRSLVASGINPVETIDKLDECQGIALKVPDPEGRRTTPKPSDEDE